VLIPDSCIDLFPVCRLQTCLSFSWRQGPTAEPRCVQLGIWRGELLTSRVGIDQNAAGHDAATVASMAKNETTSEKIEQALLSGKASAAVAAPGLSGLLLQRGCRDQHNSTEMCAFTPL
jgi:hypothetical protein